MRVSCRADVGLNINLNVVIKERQMASWTSITWLTSFLLVSLMLNSCTVQTAAVEMNEGYDDFSDEAVPAMVKADNEDDDHTRNAANDHLESKGNKDEPKEIVDAPLSDEQNENVENVDSKISAPPKKNSSTTKSSIAATKATSKSAKNVATPNENINEPKDVDDTEIEDKDDKDVINKGSGKSSMAAVTNRKSSTTRTTTTTTTTTTTARTTRKSEDFDKVDHNSVLHTFPARNDDAPSRTTSYIVLLAILCAVLYLAFANKKKIIALLLEGRRKQSGRGGRRRHQYRKLDNRLEEETGGDSDQALREVIY